MYFFLFGLPTLAVQQYEVYAVADKMLASQVTSFEMFLFFGLPILSSREVFRQLPARVVSC